MPFLLQPTRRPVARMTVHIGRHPVDFARVTLRDGSTAMLAEVTAEIAEAAEQYGNLFAHLEGDPRTVRRTSVEVARAELATDSAAPATDSTYPPPVAAALRNGWTYDDLTGAGRGDDWGPGGGTNTRTGLTIAEMAISRPPEGWGEKHADGYPWEFVGWKPPGIGWKPPAGGIKRQPEKPPEPVIAADAEPPAALVDDAPALEVDEAPAERTSAPPAIDPEVALKDLDDEQREAAITVLIASWRASGSPPTRSKLNAHLKRAGHTTFTVKTDAALNALIDLAPAV